jgi:hypothetical protein
MMPNEAPEPSVGHEKANPRRPDSQDGGWRISVLVIVTAVVTVVAGFVSLAALVHLIDYFSVVEGLLTSVFAVLALAEFLAWRRRGFSGDTILEAAVTAQLVTMPLAAFAAFVLAPSKLVLMILTTGYVVLGMGRLWVHLRCMAIKQARHEHSGSTPRLDASRTNDEELGPSASEESKPSILSVLAGSLGYTQQIGSLVAAVLALATTFAFTTDIQAVALHQWRIAATPPWQTRPSSKSHSHLSAVAAQARHHTPATGASTRASYPPGAQPERQADPPATAHEEVTPSCAKLSPTPSVTLTAVEEMEERFRDSPVGAAVLGCPTSIESVKTAQGRLYWADGFRESRPSESRPSESRPSSIVVAAPDHTYFVCLAPAVQPIEQLLRKKIPLTAPRRFPRFYVGSGSVYLLYSPRGSYLLEQELLDRGTGAVPFVELPPSVAAATISTYRQYGHWLWPSAPRSSGKGEELFELVSPGAGSPREHIFYDQRSGVATRGSEGWRYLANQENLDLESLLSFRPPISQGEEQFEDQIARAER